MAQDLAWAPVLARGMGSVVHQDTDVHKIPHRPGKLDHHQLDILTHMHCTNLQDNRKAQEWAQALVLAKEMGSEHRGNDENMNPRKPHRSLRRQLGTLKRMHCKSLLDNRMAPDWVWAPVLAQVLASEMGLVEHRGNDEHRNQHMPGR